MQQEEAFMNSQTMLLAISRDLSRRVEQLCDNLTVLRDRLRGSIADAVGQALGNVVRDTILRLLGNAARFASEPSPYSRQLWYERDEYDDHQYDLNWREEDEDEAPAVHPSRLNAALSISLQTLAWCMNCRRLRYGVLIAVVAGGLAYAMPMLAVVGLI